MRETPPALVERTKFESMKADRDKLWTEYVQMERVAQGAQAALRRVGDEIDARLDIGSPSPEDLRMWKRMIEEALG